MKSWMIVSVLFLGMQSHADSLVTCMSNGRNGSKVVEYLIKSTQSARLNSGIFYSSNNQVIPFDQSSVAQYKATARELFLIIDNANENILIKMSAHKHSAKRDNQGKYRGKVLELNPADGLTIRKVEVACSLVAL